MIDFNPHDLEGMVRLMDKYADSEFPFEGKNENGETVLISINKNNIAVETFQANEWVRINTYWRDGTTEETFER